MFFEAVDQPWKRNTEGAVGGYWGLYDKNRKDKGYFAGPVSNFPDSGWFAALSLGLALFGGLFASRKGAPSAVWRYFALSAVLAAGPVLIALQLHDFFYTLRTTADWVWGGVAALFMLAAFFVLLSRTVSRGDSTRWSDAARPDLPPGALSPSRAVTRSQIFFWGSTLLVVLESIGLVFDARYRSFPAAGFLLIGAALVTVVSGSNCQDRGILVKQSLGLLLIPAALFILINETPLNWQADLWVLTLGLWILALCLDGTVRPSGIRHLKMAVYYTAKTLLLLALPFAFAACVRYALMQSPVVADHCSENADFWYCSARSYFGILIHFRVFPKIAIFLTLLAWFFRRRASAPLLATAGLVLSVPGLVLYNVDMVGVAFFSAFVVVGLLTGKRQVRPGTTPSGAAGAPFQSQP